MIQARNIFTRSQAAHWYRRDGSPCHTVTGANGKDRDTNKRDARKLSLAPSVTKINDVAAARQLENWKVAQYLSVAYTMPPIDDEDPEVWGRKIIQTVTDQGVERKAVGTKLHAYAEDYNLDKSHGLREGEPAIIQAGFDGYKAWFNSCIKTVGFAEKGLAHSLGIGGTADLIAETYSGVLGVFDIKSKETKPGVPIVTYGNNKRQLAAYERAIEESLGLDIGIMGNIYISTTEEGRVEFVEFPRDEWANNWEAFKALLRFWQIDEGYRPDWV